MLGVKSCRHQLAQGDCSGICCCSLPAAQVTDVLAKGRKRGRQGAGGAGRMARAEPFSSPFNGHLVYLSEKSGSGPVLLNMLQG